jgi:HD-like signal output (HDOD) protein
LFHKLTTAAVSSHRQFTALERRFLGCDHAEISAAALIQWGFPEPIAEIVRYHHDHERATEDNRYYTKILHVADMIGNHLGYSDHSGDIIEPFDISAWHDLGLKDDDIPSIQRDADKKIEKTEIFAGLSS